MSIKRRLYISNALMFILPLLLVAVMGYVSYLAFASFTGYNTETYRQQRIMVTNNSSAESYFESGDFESIPSGVRLYHSPTEGYLVVTPDELRVPVDTYSSYNSSYLPLAPFLFIVLIVIIVNGLLTRYIFRSIMNPIEVLTHGVHEIRDGNLGYRIAYEKTDEFAFICDDFNDMGAHLSDMVEQRQKDEKSRRELIAGISHDLRTPLTAIKAYIEGLEKGVASTPQMKTQYLETIKEKTESMEHIINQLFAFSKLDIGDFPLTNESIDIVEELRSIVEDYAHLEEEQESSISFTGCSEPLFCMLDVVQFQNVIHNILGNSLKYKTARVAHIDVSCSEQGNRGEILIADDGPGVPEEVLNKLFEVFYRTDSSRQNPERGSGIGLAISQKIIEQFGGTIQARNGAGGGLQIIISLPLIEGESHG